MPQTNWVKAKDKSMIFCVRTLPAALALAGVFCFCAAPAYSCDKDTVSKQKGAHSSPKQVTRPKTLTTAKPAAIKVIDLKDGNDSGLATLVKSRKKIEGLYVLAHGLTNNGLKPLANQPALRHLTLFGANEISDEGISHLEGLVNLEELKIVGSAVTSKSFYYLRKMKRLRELEITPAGGPSLIADNDFRSIESITSLKTLVLNRARISDKAALSLAKLTSLEHLHLWETGITAKSAAVIGSLSRLKTLSIPIYRYADDWLKELRRLHNLEAIFEVAGSDLTDQGVIYLSELSKLRNLNLAGTKISSNGFTPLCALGALEQLNLCQTNISDQSLAAVLNGMKSLTELHLEKTRITGVGLRPLQFSSRFKTLSVNTNVSSAGLSVISGLKAIENLDLSRNKIKCADIRTLARIKSLRELSLKNADFGLEQDYREDRSTQCLTPLGSMHQLRVLNLVNVNGITNFHTAQLQKQLPQCNVASLEIHSR